MKANQARIVMTHQMKVVVMAVMIQMMKPRMRDGVLLKISSRKGEEG